MKAPDPILELLEQQQKDAVAWKDREYKYLIDSYNSFQMSQAFCRLKFKCLSWKVQVLPDDFVKATINGKRTHYGYIKLMGKSDVTHLRGVQLDGAVKYEYCLLLKKKDKTPVNSTQHLSLDYFDSVEILERGPT